MFEKQLRPKAGSRRPGKKKRAFHLQRPPRGCDDGQMAELKIFLRSGHTVTIDETEFRDTRSQPTTGTSFSINFQIESPSIVYYDPEAISAIVRVAPLGPSGAPPADWEHVYDDLPAAPD